MLWIEWGRLYSAQPAQRAFADRRIRAFAWREGLIFQGVRIAVCTYVFFQSFDLPCADNVQQHGVARSLRGTPYSPLQEGGWVARRDPPRAPADSPELRDRRVRREEGKIPLEA
jgi:hypothetical protein